MLMDHSDAQFGGILWGVDRSLLAVDKNRTAVGAVNPRQHIHQCRFAGSVLAKKGENLALLDIQINVIVGDNSAERFVMPFNSIAVSCAVNTSLNVITYPKIMFCGSESGIRHNTIDIPGEVLGDVLLGHLRASGHLLIALVVL